MLRMDEIMLKNEEKIVDAIRKNIFLLFLILITVLGLLLRFTGMNFESGDYQDFLYHWWNRIQPEGIFSMKNQVGNYNIPYQFLIAVFTYLPFGPLFSYKIMSVFFDMVLAVSAALLTYELTGKQSKIKAGITYALVFCSINVILNSAFWAQCDSMYVSFIILAVYFLIKHKNIASFVMLGIALAFKLQTVFIFPFFLLYYFMTKKCSIFHFLIIPAVDVLMCLPAIIMGRPFMDIINIYVVQTDYGKQIQMNCPNLYAFMCNNLERANYDLLKPFAILFTAAVLVTMFVLLVIKMADLKNNHIFLLVLLWSVWTCILFLPSMHERYGYLLDVLVVIYAVYSFKRVCFAVVCNWVSLRGYCFYLFKYDSFDIRYTAVIYLIFYVYLTVVLLKETVFTNKSADLKKLTA